MSAESHLYQHTYSDGDKVTLSLQFSGDLVSLSLVPIQLTKEHEGEFTQWVSEYLVIDIEERFGLERLAQITVLLMSVLGKQEKGEDFKESS